MFYLKSNGLQVNLSFWLGHVRSILPLFFLNLDWFIPRVNRFLSSIYQTKNKANCRVQFKAHQIRDNIIICPVQFNNFNIIQHTKNYLGSNGIFCLSFFPLPSPFWIEVGKYNNFICMLLESLYKTNKFYIY